MAHTWPRNLSLKLCQSEFWPLPEDVPFCLPLPCIPCCPLSDALFLLPLLEFEAAGSHGYCHGDQVHYYLRH